MLALPVDVAQALPGWPDELSRQFAEQGTDLIVSGPGISGLSGIDTAQALEALPDGLDAYVWTDRIDLLGEGG